MIACRKTAAGTVVLSILAIAAVFVLSGCRRSSAPPEPITTAELERHIRFLSSDAMEGRGIGTPGIEKAARYQEDWFRSFGLQPAFGSSFRQEFAMRGSLPDPAARVEFDAPAKQVLLAISDQFVVNGEREDAPPEVSGEVVYAGYLIQAPERNWDDVKGQDLRGKVLLCEVNEPGNAPGGIFDGEDMTWYGRWPYKFEEAARLGAAGVFIIHDAKGAAYGWEVLKSTGLLESFFLPEKERPLFFQGWVSADAAQAIFAAAGQDHAAWKAKAETPEFAPVALPLRARVRQRPTFRTVRGANVAGWVRAKAPKVPGRAVLLTAHYDHFGKDDTLEGDKIFNGAVDNCSASAALLSLAAFYAQRPEDLRADLLFAAVTAEEKLMLGSEYLARHLPVPASNVLADVNFEMTNVWGPVEDAFAIGARFSDLDAVCRDAAAAVGLRYTPDRSGPLGFFFRSDQLSFAKAGIPGVWLHQGRVSRGPEPDRAGRLFDEYRAAKYHRVTDEYGPEFDLRGTVQMTDWAREIVRRVSEGQAMPQFRPDASFRRPEQ